MTSQRCGARSSPRFHRPRNNQTRTSKQTICSFAKKVPTVARNYLFICATQQRRGRGHRTGYPINSTRHRNRGFDSTPDAVGVTAKRHRCCVDHVYRNRVAIKRNRGLVRVHDHADVISGFRRCIGNHRASGFAIASKHERVCLGLHACRQQAQQHHQYDNPHCIPQKMDAAPTEAATYPLMVINARLTTMVASIAGPLRARPRMGRARARGVATPHFFYAGSAIM